MAKKKKSKRKKPASSDNPLARLQLWQWGLFFMIGGPLAYQISPLINDIGNMRGAAKQGAEFGAACASVFFVLLGIGLIITHFVRRR